MDIIDDVLSNGDHQPRRSDIREDIFLLPQVHFVAHKDYVNHFHVIGAEYPEYVQPNEEHSRFKTQSSRGNPLLQDNDFEVPAVVGSSDYIEWLQEKGASFMTTRNRNLTCKLLVKLAGDLKPLPPGIDLPSCDLDQLLVVESSSWMDKLILEMRTVEGIFSSEVRDSGISVLTNQPYPTLLRGLAEAIMEQGPRPNPLFQDGKEELPVNISSNEYVEWLESKSSFIGEMIMNRPASLTHCTWNQIQSAFRILMKLAEDLKYLRPGDESHLGYDIKMVLWRVYWNELIAEMKTVEASCSSEIRYSGVYVLTTWPYTDFLRTLAGKLSECTTWSN